MTMSSLNLSRYFDQTGNEHFSLTEGLYYSDLFGGADIKDVQIYVPNELIIVLRVGIAIAPRKSFSRLISAAGRRNATGSLYPAAYAGYIYYNIDELDYFEGSFEESVLEYMLFIGDIVPPKSEYEPSRNLINHESNVPKVDSFVGDIFIYKE
eukprot:snap_masked-scaffold_60-processed-gene-0.46-mRNA-1 protein AED:1.00 eAED:1.00 QI:0/0/0/0/1/1/3/0/152